MTSATDRELTITRVFDAPRNLVYRAWTDPDHFVRWLGPSGFVAPSATLNVRPGGLWRACIRSERDGTELWMRGVYREVVEPERLVFTFAWDEDDGSPGNETLVEIDFAELGGRTEMVFRQTGFVSVEDRDGHRGGWGECFDDLERFLTY